MGLEYANEVGLYEKKTSSAFEVNEKQLSLPRCLLVGSRPLKPLTYGKVR